MSYLIKISNLHYITMNFDSKLEIIYRASDLKIRSINSDT